MSHADRRECIGFSSHRQQKTLKNCRPVADRWCRTDGRAASLGAFLNLNYFLLSRTQSTPRTRLSTTVFVLVPPVPPGSLARIPRTSSSTLAQGQLADLETFR